MFLKIQNTKLSSTKFLENQKSSKVAISVIISLILLANLGYSYVTIEVITTGNSVDIILENLKSPFSDKINPNKSDLNNIVTILENQPDIENSYVMANYIFGLPGDTKETMKKTFDLSLELCTAGWNTYAAMALPGSQLYKNALEKKYKLPESYEGYSFHSYETQPLPTETLKPEEILEYRDKSFINYHTDKTFLDKIERKFGQRALGNIKDMTKVNLKRKILGDQL